LIEREGDISMGNNRKKILVVDDEPDLLNFLRAFLEDNGFDVIFASDGKECFKMAKEEQPDLITLDITMPEESGVRAFRNIQEDEKTKDIPVIIVTGVSKEFKKFIHTRRKVQPPAAYMEKPVDTAELLAKINEILGQ
jgi:DNA-binding response OmpR family regulator